MSIGNCDTGGGRRRYQTVDVNLIVDFVEVIVDFIEVIVDFVEVTLDFGRRHPRLR